MKGLQGARKDPDWPRASSQQKCFCTLFARVTESSEVGMRREERSFNALTEGQERMEQCSGQSVGSTSEEVTTLAVGATPLRRICLKLDVIIAASFSNRRV